ncbi:MAG: hypothetical protein A2474_01870 [Elusimicrobia bacterium RIFOXYC2_FULL_34_12]|nr:MAG: hypothetical protein A2474_01870 [Elusimicrobia bacterium RIFOXYC2_FULL_34_12]OGS38654.1 MAG: hypothetical protein A2551_06520 [Elusimicrobia bacterium RIFOXYD2_FULL_34_30]HAM39490.1 hypothetical protein [Elusimicrobiota bacterium]
MTITAITLKRFFLIINIDSKKGRLNKNIVVKLISKTTTINKYKYFANLFFPLNKFLILSIFI